MDVSEMARLGNRAMRAGQSLAEGVMWPLMAGRRREVRASSALEAVVLGRKAAGRLYAVVAAAGLSVEDAACVLVSGPPGTEVEHLFTPYGSERADLALAVILVDRGIQASGIRLRLWDREKGRAIEHTRPV